MLVSPFQTGPELKSALLRFRGRVIGRNQRRRGSYFPLFSMFPGPSCRVDGVLLDAVFDPSSTFSYVPQSCTLLLSARMLLITMWSSSRPFSCLVSVQRHPGSEVRLGTDWLAAFCELHILNGDRPPSVASVVLDPFSLGVEGKCPIAQFAALWLKRS